MANLTAAREDQRKDDLLVAFPVKTGVTIYKGALVGVDATGYAKPAPATDKRVVGVAYETVAAGASAPVPTPSVPTARVRSSSTAPAWLSPTLATRSM